MRKIRLCVIEECGSKHYIRGWCRNHYSRWYRHGDPNAGNRRYNTPEEAFAARTEWQGDCLVWTGGTCRKGYGSLFDHTKAHRWAYERENGPIPEGLVIDHICHNKSCCNVAHLRAVTQKQNLENLSGPRPGSSSKYLGVCWHKGANKWIVQVGHFGVRYYGGIFSNEEQANIAAIALRNKLYTHNDRDKTVLEFLADNN